ncbi:hypothetical protein DAI22_04g208200 [Oryza sativa Japonica Group]|nr:hypothetical protein DAI22_04g208200 [Oryza sativa Japonica Group]
MPSRRQRLQQPSGNSKQVAHCIFDWAILQNKEEETRRLQEGGRLLKRVVNEVYSTRHGWGSKTGR